MIQDDEAIFASTLTAITDDARLDGDFERAVLRAGKTRARRRTLAGVGMAALAFSCVGGAALALQHGSTATTHNIQAVKPGHPTGSMAPMAGCLAAIPTITLNGVTVSGGSERPAGSRVALSQSSDAQVTISRGQISTGARGAALKDLSAQLVAANGTVIASGNGGSLRKAQSNNGGDTVAVTIPASQLQQLPVGDYVVRLASNTGTCDGGSGYSSTSIDVPISITR